MIKININQGLFHNSRLIIISSLNKLSSKNMVNVNKNSPLFKDNSDVDLLKILNLLWNNTLKLLLL